MLHQSPSPQPKCGPLLEARRMLSLFASVGAMRFDVTFLDIDGAKRGFRKDQGVGQLTNSLPHLFPGLAERQQSLIVRPIAGENVVLIQLDDLAAGAAQRVCPMAFLTLETSPGNHQAWVAVSGIQDSKDFSRRLRKGAGADPSASGATRLAGTVNYKHKYAPEFPTVAVIAAAPGWIVTAEQAESAGLLAPREPQRPAAPIRVPADRTWPDYERCIQGAPMNHSQTAPDISRADFLWCMMSAQRGWPTDAIAARLLELSSKARENGERYAELTAHNATAAAITGSRRRG